VALIDSVYIIAILIAIVAAPFFFIAWSNGSSPRKRWRVFSVIALLFPICVVLGWLVSLASTSIAQFKAHEFLDSISNQSVVRVNGKPVQNRDEILSAIKTIRDLPAHHSSPTHTIDVELSDPPRPRLRRGKDGLVFTQQLLGMPREKFPSRISFQLSAACDLAAQGIGGPREHFFPSSL
jgi:hypothetical protein